MFILEQFEHLTYTRQYARAATELVKLLTYLDQTSGLLGAITPEGGDGAPELTAPNAGVLARLGAAITALAADPELRLPEQLHRALLDRQPWLASLFHASVFCTTDHLLRAMRVDAEASSFRIAAANLWKFGLFYTAESEIPVDFEALWRQNKTVTANLCLALCAPLVMISSVAHAKREQALRWLPSRLGQVEDLEHLPMASLHSVYMHCSYADATEKHEIKKPLNVLIQRKLREIGFVDLLMPGTIERPSGKPVVLVVVERFTNSSSIYRTHSSSLEALRRRFHVVGMGFDRTVDDAGRAVFDEFRALQPADGIWAMLGAIRRCARDIGASVLYMPSVGMESLTVFLSNLRVAPIQVMGLGHPATSHSSLIDYVVVEDDFVGDETCFSEKLLRIPSDAMPYRPSSALHGRSPVGRHSPPSELVHVAVASTPMKLNPGFLSVCKQIALQAGRPVKLHFFLGGAVGLVYQQARHQIERRLGNAADVHPHQDYYSYLLAMAKCDLFLNPFPFGNTNGTIDAVAAGLVGVCSTGREVHAHIDGALFKRLHWPAWLTTHSNEEYISAAVRLIDQQSERCALATALSGPSAMNALCQGRPEVLADWLMECFDGSMSKNRPS